MVASEATPYAKSGGLADVAGSLPKALARLGHDVTVVVPRYRGIAVPKRVPFRVIVELGSRQIDARIYRDRTDDGVRVWLVDRPEFYDRDFLYGRGGEDYADNALRFAFLSKAALCAAVHERLRPDIIHAHDWQTGLVPLYLRTHFANEAGLASAATVFTIHNLAYQGLFDKAWLPDIGFGWDLFDVEALEYWDRISFMKAGINFADRLTTVSQRYAQEIQTPVAGFGFEGVVRRRAGVLSGILNGIDVDTWDPANDAYAPRYDVHTLDDKRHAKKALLERYRLPVTDYTMRRPLIAMVSRMVDQKGLDLVASIGEDLPHLGALFTIHGTGEWRYEDMWRRLAAMWPDRVGVLIGYEESIAHLAEAGSDLWLMPSRFEPCGLNQMYSQRYGTLPIVHATGGLDDTVDGFDTVTGTGTGFKFYTAEPVALLNTIRWALSIYEDRAAWRRMQEAAMRKDFSWARAAAAYLEAFGQARLAADARAAAPV
jgi:starch synthase